MKSIATLVALGIVVACALVFQSNCAPKQGKAFMKKFTVTSTAFKHNAMIPSVHTCDGKDISPELTWKNAPDKTKSFALIVDDPDAPKPKPWVHWVVFNIPADTHILAENTSSNDFIVGANSFPAPKSTQWDGPCPPSGTHRYFFKLYALDTILDLKPGATKEDVERAMKGHILDTAELIGKYKRAK